MLAPPCFRACFVEPKLQTACVCGVEEVNETRHRCVLTRALPQVAVEMGLLRQIMAALSGIQ